jgi:nucleotide-binding universal stress UspA family protein
VTLARARHAAKDLEAFHVDELVHKLVESVHQGSRQVAMKRHSESERISRRIRWETLTRSGFPAAVIAAAAKDSNVDLIEMATHGRNRSALEHLFLGSVAERVVRTSVCAMLVLPPA